MWFGQDRRQHDRRQEENRPVAPAEQENRQQTDRRQVQRRQCFRVVYPLEAAPQVINHPLRVIDLSIKAVRFKLSGKLVQDIKLDDGTRIQLSFKFRDDQLVDIGGVIYRHTAEANGDMVYVCRFNRDLPAALVNNEQAFLLKNYPEFCRQVRK